MKSIDTLVKDIYDVVGEGTVQVTDEEAQTLGKTIANILSSRLNAKNDRKPGLSMSNFGSPCDRKLWYTCNLPDKIEKLQPYTKLKFLIGDIWEELLLFLAHKAGHKIEGRQDTLEIDGLIGHRDAVIDGHLVDVKSANSRTALKFKNHKLEQDDPFGYLDQINLYHTASGDEVTNKDQVVFLVGDKELGHIFLDKYPVNKKDYSKEIKHKRAMLSMKSPPPRAYSDEPEGKSGNRKLCAACNYCGFKKDCWPGLRTFLYAKGPVYLTQVVKTPDVPELNPKRPFFEEDYEENAQ